MQIIMEKDKWTKMAELLSAILAQKQSNEQLDLEREWRDRGLKTQEYWMDRDKKIQTREDEDRAEAAKKRQAYEQMLGQYGEMPEYLDSPQMPGGLEALGIQGGSFVPDAFENEARKAKGMDILRQQVAMNPEKWSPQELAAGSQFWGTTGRGREQAVQAAEEKKRAEAEALAKAKGEERRAALAEKTEAGKELIRERARNRAPREPRQPKESAEVGELRRSIIQLDEDIAKMPDDDARKLGLMNLRNRRMARLKALGGGLQAAAEEPDAEPDSDTDDFAAFAEAFRAIAGE